MTLIDILLSLLQEHPIFFSLLALFIYGIIFGDRKLWDYQAKFPLKEGIGRGEVELKGYKKKGSKIELKFSFTSDYQNKTIEIFTNSLLLYTIQAEYNNQEKLFIKDQFQFDKPNEGDEINVRVGGEAVFSAPLVID